MKLTKRLYKVEISSWNAEFTELEVELLKPMFPGMRHSTLEDYRTSYEVRQRPEEEREEYAKKLFDDYRAKPARRIQDSVSAIIDVATIDPLTLTKLDIKAEVPVTFEADAPDDTLFKILARFESATERSINAVQTFNKQCNVHIGGSLLMTVNDLKLLNDACTDVLQSELNSGWRIIAACVQPDGRRPDYVLGRYNPELYNDGSAKR